MVRPMLHELSTYDTHVLMYALQKCQTVTYIASILSVITSDANQPTRGALVQIF